jgi:hydrogenase nickel incorporation protein HypA/HybF
MHEFSIVQSIVEIALDSASRHGIKKISSVEVEVGEASGVVKEAMEFAWEAAGKGTILDGASLVIIPVPLRVICGICRSQYLPADIYEACPKCGEINPEIISGKELRVIAIETASPPA